MLNPKDVLDLKSIEKSRNITTEILNFGVSQNEIIKIIELLSLELEDIHLMREISSCLNKTKTEEVITEKVKIEV